MDNVSSSALSLPMVARHVTVGGRLVRVTVCPPRPAAGVLPLHIDPIRVVHGRPDMSCPNDGSHEYPGAIGDAVEFGDVREEEDAFFSRPLRLR